MTYLRPRNEVGLAVVTEPQARPQNVGVPGPPKIYEAAQKVEAKKTKPGFLPLYNIITQQRGKLKYGMCH